MSPIEVRNRFVLRLGVIAIALFAGFISWSLYWGAIEDREYPSLGASEQMMDQVQSVRITRHAVRVQFTSGVKRTIGFAQNTAYTPSENIYQMLRGQDRIVKPADSDTIRVQREGRIFVFVLGSTIDCCNE